MTVGVTPCSDTLKEWSDRTEKSPACLCCTFVGEISLVSRHAATKCFGKLYILAKNLSYKERQQLGFVAEDALQQYAGHDGSFLELCFPAPRKQRSSARNSNIGPISLGTARITLHRSALSKKASVAH